jgi:hypothetical protein
MIVSCGVGPSLLCPTRIPPRIPLLARSLRILPLVFRLGLGTCCREHCIPKLPRERPRLPDQGRFTYAHSIALRTNLLRRLPLVLCSDTEL